MVIKIKGKIIINFIVSIAVVLSTISLAYVSAQVTIGGDGSGSSGVVIIPPVVVPFSNSSFNQTFGDGQWWRLDGLNQGNITSSWDMGLFDFNATKFFGLFNIFTSSIYLNVFNGSTVVLDDDLLNTNLNQTDLIETVNTTNNLIALGGVTNNSAGWNITFDQIISDEIYANQNITLNVANDSVLCLDPTCDSFIRSNGTHSIWK